MKTNPTPTCDNPFALVLGMSWSLLAPTIGHGQADFPAGGSSPNIYFASAEEDVYEKTRCDDDQTIVYFSNGVATDVAGALASKERLEDNLIAYLKRKGTLTEAAFGDFTTALAFTETTGGGLSFLKDLVLRVAPDDALFYEAQRQRFAAGLDILPNWMQKRAAAEAIALETELRDSSVAAGPHADAYDALLSKGRGNIIVGHSYGTILANASYYLISEHNRPGHALVQTALMSTEVSGADRFGSYPTPYTTIHEDAIAVVFPRNLLSNVDNFDNEKFPNNNGKPILGHSFVENYMNTNPDELRSGTQSANDKIMSDIVAMRLRLEPRPCHGHILGGAAVVTDNLTGRESTSQLSRNEIGRYVLHPSPLAATAAPAPDGPTKLVDWRGQFVNDEATRVLAFSGPAGRYNGPAAYRNAVHRWGKIAYRAPGPVLGAAIQRDEAGEEWIVVATHNLISPRRYNSNIGDTVTVWRRRAKLLDLSSAVYDISMNPFGWGRILVATFPAGLQTGPWFFNGDGTEAASVRLVDDRRAFSEREKDPDCFRNEEVLPPGYCTPGPDGFGAAYAVGERDVKKTHLYTLSIPLPGSGGVPGMSTVPTGIFDAGVMAVDYDKYGQLVLREENIATDRGYLDDPDPASVADFRWLTVNGTPLTDSATLRCTEGSAPCRLAKSAGINRSGTGFVALLGDLAKEPRERIRYHLFYVDLRTRTYAFSRREGNRTEYWLAHKDETPKLLGEVDGLPLERYDGYTGSRYGYEGDKRNLMTDAEANVLVERDGQRVAFGKWPKVNPILGLYEAHVNGLDFSIAPPPTFGIDVAVDGSVLASGVLPDGVTFNYHSAVDLERELGMPLAGVTLLPIGVR